MSLKAMGYSSKMHRYIPPVNNDELLFVKRISELCELNIQNGIPKITAFLSDRQQELALAQIHKLGCVNYSFCGGKDICERKILVIGEGNDNSIFCIFVKPSVGAEKLTHRDYLGAMLALNIKRECIGDILICFSGALIYVNKSAYTLAVNELREVGRYSVQVSDGSNINVEMQTNEPTLQEATVASLRLDNLLCAMCNISRTSAQSLVKSALVCVNHISIKNLHFDMQESDVVSIKGKGKYKLCEICGKSRKDRIFIKFICY